MRKGEKIYISGHTGLLGSALLKTLRQKGYTNIATKTHQELDLRDSRLVSAFFSKERPKYVFHAAARVGSITDNIKHPANFITDNILIQTNIIHEAYKNKVKKLISFGSNCAYPRLAPQPMKEEFLLTGPIEPTNEAYGMAKVAGMIMSQSYNKQYGTDFISLIPASLYGPNDHFTGDRAHIIPRLIKKFHDAKIKKELSIVIRDNPKKYREYLFVDDLAEACVYFMLKDKSKNREKSIINIGTGDGISLRHLSFLIRDSIGYKGKIIWADNVPAGMPKKILNPKYAHRLGWRSKTDLATGIKTTYKWYLGQK